MFGDRNMSMLAEGPSKDFSSIVKVAYEVHMDPSSAINDQGKYAQIAWLSRAGFLKPDDSGRPKEMDYGIFGQSKEKVGVLDIYTKVVEKFFNTSYSSHKK